jgi:hypothetical protein
MRLLPVQDRLTDFAPVNPLIADVKSRSASQRSAQLRQARDETQARTPSYFLWLFIVTVIPPITYGVFRADLQDQWSIVFALSQAK